MGYMVVAYAIFLNLVENLYYCVGVQPDSKSGMCLTDLETVKVLGKGSGGVVQLVRHRWTNETYALKVNNSAKLSLAFSESWCFKVLKVCK